ncbi:hypothetical protein [Paraflavitalea sp. CAU 1676]|uniref:hypothetical protein n=1 Tax=Paraflavitalea sp. CAU 1676 TaxID=3032598 RepID=UPI0023DB99F8|nr:hypothetical protein [Paraflavitalea sp. CAU 1676]MDF2191203.1 hypothetical protein [Paraflavitalea sp. CAU 1676]
MKKIFLLATIAMLMSSVATYANEGNKHKNKGSKAKTEKNCDKPCPKTCPKPCPPACGKDKCGQR